MRSRLVPAATLLAVGALIGWLASSTRSGTEARAQNKAAEKSVSRYEGLANLPFAEDYPTPETARQLRDELLFQQATQSYLWALPAINMWAMKEGSEKQFGAGYNVLPVWRKRMNAKTLVTTPNSDVIYAMGYVDVGRDGPLVIEVPPRQQGILDDFWQRPLTGPTIDQHTFVGDVGFAGPDKGEGGKYLLLPPGYKGEVPDGYFVYRSRTNNIFVFWRAFFRDPAQLEEPVKLIEQTRIYPLGKKDSAKSMQFPDASGVPCNMLFPPDGRYFEQLSRFIESEAVEPADVDWRGMLAAIGIVKGQPFKPDDRTKMILNDAAKTAFKTSKVMAFGVFPAKKEDLIYTDRQWTNPLLGNYSKAGPEMNLEWLNRSGSFRDLNARVNMFTSYYSVSPVMARRTAGPGAAYVIGFRDRDGDLYAGGKNYVLRLPAGIPVSDFWSATVYDALTASGLDNGQPFPSLNKMDKPAQNADGSTDLYFGPEAPKGKEKNWLKTVPGKGYFVIFRLYGPEKAFFDQTWKPSDIEKVK